MSSISVAETFSYASKEKGSSSSSTFPIPIFPQLQQSHSFESFGNQVAQDVNSLRLSSKNVKYEEINEVDEEMPGCFGDINLLGTKHSIDSFHGEKN